MNWKKVFNNVELGFVVAFVAEELSYNDFYKEAVRKGVGPEVRLLKTYGVDKARKSAKNALKRRNVTV